MNKVESSNDFVTDSQEEGWQKLTEIADFLYAEGLKPHFDYGVTNGKMGIFLFLFEYCAHVYKEDRFDSGMEKLLMEAIASLYTGDKRNMLYYKGISELGSLILYLQEQEYLDESFNEVLTKIDFIALQGLPALLARGNYDFFTGYMPIARYFLTRNTREAREALGEIVQNLFDISERHEKGVFFRSRLFDSGTIYLGWSHGLAGLLLFLEKVLKSRQLPADETRISFLIKDIVGFIQSHRIYDGVHLFPDVVAGDNGSMPLNLCYGDLGVAYAIWKSGMALRDHTLEEIGMKDLLFTAGRRNAEMAGIRDASIIYGAMGTALFFKRLGEDTGNHSFKEASDFWYHTGLELSRENGVVAGYTHIFNKGKSFTGNSLSEGLAGYGLGIMEIHGCNDRLLDILGY